MRITGKTKIMFVLAHPVGHVRAPALLNDHFDQTGKDVAVSPLHVMPDDLGEALQFIRKLRNVAGFGVTIPHKISVMPLLDGVTERARQVGAVNFVRRDEDGSLLGDNMDGIGFVAGLRRNDLNPEGRRVMLLGAGGAGRAIAFALAGSGVSELRIANRDAGKAQELALAVARSAPTCAILTGAASLRDYDLVVNATPLGMKADDPLPIGPDGFGKRTALADIIMAPPVTRLMEAAAARGATIVGVMPC